MPSIVPLTADKQDETPLTPTEDLVMEVLAARYRLGERLWTFDSRHAKAIRRLSERGLVTEMSGMVERSIRASLTEAGVTQSISQNYVPPSDTVRLLTRNKILTALMEIDQPDAAALATLLSHRLVRPGGGA